MLNLLTIFLGKSDQHDQWNVLNLLTYNFSIKDNFQQGGIVPSTHTLLGEGQNLSPYQIFAIT